MSRNLMDINTFETSKPIDINHNLLNALRCGRVFAIKTITPGNNPTNSSSYDPTSTILGHITNISYHDDGNVAVVSTDADYVHLIDVKTGVITKIISLEKSGCDALLFTHHELAFLSAPSLKSSSLKSWNKGIRYTSLYDNKDLRYYSGHNDTITSMSLIADGFITSSLDKTVRIWNISSPHCQGVIRCPAPTLITTDPMSTVLAMSLENNIIHLLDYQQCESGPFSSFCLEGPIITTTCLSFSPDGSLLLVCGTVIEHPNNDVRDVGKGCIYIVDSFDAHIVNIFSIPADTNSSNTNKLYSPQASFTPDGKFISCNNYDGSITTFDVHDTTNESNESSKKDSSESSDSKTNSKTNSTEKQEKPRFENKPPICKLFHASGNPVTHVKWNPRRVMMMTVTPEELALWIPIT